MTWDKLSSNISNFKSHIIPNVYIRSMTVVFTFFVVGFIVYKLIYALAGSDASSLNGSILEVSSNFALVIIASYFIPLIINYTTQKSSTVSIVLDETIKHTQELATILDSLLSNNLDQGLIKEAAMKIRTLNFQVQFLAEIDETIKVVNLDTNKLKKDLIEIKKMATNDKFSGSAGLPLARARACNLTSQFKKNILLLKIKNCCRLD